MKPLLTSNLMIVLIFSKISSFLSFRGRSSQQKADISAPRPCLEIFLFESGYNIIISVCYKSG